MEFRASVTIAHHGMRGESADAALNAFLALFPDAGPVVTQNTEDGWLRITIGLDATDPWAAANLAGRVFADGLNHAGLEVTPVLDIAVTVVDPAQAEDQAEHESWELVSA